MALILDTGPLYASRRVSSRGLHRVDYGRIRELCDRYADADIGFVDAAVLTLVERLGEDKLATLDERHFRTLRPRHVDTLRLLPGDGVA